MISNSVISLESAAGLLSLLAICECTRFRADDNGSDGAGDGVGAGDGGSDSDSDCTNSS